jgi:hypothetical protein
MTMNVTTDLRGGMQLIRHQGSRPTCLAFALSDLNSAHQDASYVLSVEYLYASAAIDMPGWRPGDGLTLSCGINAVASPGQPTEENLPYTMTEPPVPLKALPLYDPMYSCSIRRMSPSVNEIIATTNDGKPLGLIVNLTLTFYSPTQPGGIIEFQDSALPNRKHAVLAVGYGIGSDTTEPHVLIRNSWGAGWGLNGYGWLPQKYIEVHALDAFGV